MDKINPLRLWRVSIVNRNGYEAPAKYVEAKKRVEAIKLAKVSSNLLTDFPQLWSFTLTPLHEIKRGGQRKEEVE